MITAAQRVKMLACAIAYALPFALTAPVAANAQDIDVSVQSVDSEFRTMVTMFVRAPKQRVWEVITDFERAPEFMRDLEVSKVVSRSGDTLRLVQKDKVRFGPFSFAMDSVRDLRLTELVSMESRLVSGSMKKYEAKTELKSVAGGTQMIYRSVAVAGSALAAFASDSLVARQTEERFRQIREEILRREVVAGACRNCDRPTP
jgi:carbon monoxide dehydrogenase subunit G